MQRKITHSLRLIAQALETHSSKIAVASSFGKDSVVVLHLAQRIDPNVQVFTVETPFKPIETIRYRDMLERIWNLNMKTYGTRTWPEDKDEGSMPLYKKDPEACCDIYKVQPTKWAVKDLQLDAWICGLRGTEGHTRKFLHEQEEKDGLIKYNPILEWTEAEVWMYHAQHNIPVHPLYMQGYRSLGCLPCSKPYTDTERSGRWAGTDKCGGECGIHTRSLK